MKNNNEISQFSEIEISKLFNAVENQGAAEPLDKVTIAATQIIEMYEEDFGEDMINRTKDTEFLKRHKAFIEAYKELAEEINPESYFDRRTLSSEGVTLHYLIVSNGLKKIVNEHADQNEKINAIRRYLEQVNIKNKESIGATDERRITVGMEWEYHDPADSYASWMFDSEMEDPNADMYKAFEKKAYIDNLPTIPKLISETGTYKDTYDKLEHGSGLREVVTNPTKRYNAPLRELIQTQAAGGLVGRVTPHETFVGIELSRHHTEVMDVRAVLTAAGYIGNYTETSEDSLWAEKVLSGASDADYMVDLDPKPSVTSDGELVYFPNFRTRDPKKLVDTMESIQKVGVEWRGFASMINYGETDDEEAEILRYKGFSDYVRRIKHEWLTAHAIAAVQKKENLTDNDLALRTLWENYLTDWNSTLDQQSIDNVSDHERFVTREGGMVGIDEIRENPYNIFVNILEAKSMTDDRFRHDARKIIRNFNQKALKIIEGA